MKNKRGATIINTYTPHWWIKWPLGFGAAVMLCFHFPVMLWASSTTPEFPKFIFAFLIPLYSWILWYAIIYCSQTRLIVYEDGLEVQHGGSHFFSTWENMSHFGRGGLNTKYYGIILFERITPEVNGLAEKLFYGWSSSFMEIGEMVNLPSQWEIFFTGPVDTDKLLDTEFGRDIYQFAPHLFEVEKEKAKHGYSQSE